MKRERKIDSNLKNLVKSMIIVFSTMFLSKILTYAYRVIIARYYGPEIYGLFTLVVVVLSLFIVFFSFGMNEGLLRYIPQLISKKDYEKARYLIKISLWATIISSIISAFIVYSFSDWIALNFIKNPEMAYMLRVFSVLLPMWAISNIFLTSLNAFEKIGIYSWLSDTFPSLIRAVTLGILAFIGVNGDAVFISYAASLVLLYAASFIAFRYYVRKTIPGGLKPDSGKQHIAKEFIFYSLPIVISGAVAKISAWTDSLSIGYFMNPAEVGFYNAAMPIALLLGMIPELFTPLFFPLINREFAGKKVKMVGLLSRQTSKWIFMLNLPAFLLLFMFPGAALNIIFGKEYLIAENALRILSIGAFASSIFYVAPKLILMKGKSNILLMNSAIALILNLILNILLVPRLGINGAAIATSSVWLVLGVTLLYESRRSTKIWSLSSELIKIALISIVPVMVIVVLRNFIDVSLVSLIYLTAIFLGVYALSLYIGGCFDEKDRLIINSIKNKAFSVFNTIIGREL